MLAKDAHQRSQRDASERRWAGSDGDVSDGWQASLRKKVSKS